MTHLALLRFALAGMCWLGCPSVLPAQHQQAENTTKDKIVLSTEVSADGLWFLKGGERVAFYQRAIKSQQGRAPRSNYIHPFFGAAQTSITEDFPADHVHHRGIFWAWHQLRLDGRQLGDPWLARDFEIETLSFEVFNQQEFIELQFKAHWHSNRLSEEQGKQQALVEEQTSIRLWDGGPHRHVMDFDISLRALRPAIQIGGSEDEKGYGGFSLRIKLDPQTKFFGADGPLQPQKTATAPSSWLHIQGRMGSDTTQSLTILGHADNPGHPHRWILRQSKSMQNAAFPGRTAIPLSQQQPLRLRYRVIQQATAASPTEAAAWYNDYVSRRPLGE